MNLKRISAHPWFRPGVGAALAVLIGMILWRTEGDLRDQQGPHLGAPWIRASYDYLFAFAPRTPTNQVVIMLLDNAAYPEMHQRRGQPWDRNLHAKLLHKLADDQPALVVFDVFFRHRTDSDSALAEAMRRIPRLLLMAEQAGGSHSPANEAQPLPEIASAGAVLPADIFLAAARSNWGVATLDPDLDGIVRRHWPFSQPRLPYDSLPWTAARLMGANLPTQPQQQWLRYYAPEGSWTEFSYHHAFGKAANYFRDKVVFIGNDPHTSLVPDDERDEFQTPFTRWEGTSWGGVKILATQFLNLWNGEWLRRLNPRLEALVLIVTGVLFGSGLCLLRPWVAAATGIGAALGCMFAAVTLSYGTNYWFPWLIVVGAQIPCATAWAAGTMVARRWRERSRNEALAEFLTPGAEAAPVPPHVDGVPHAPDYDIFPKHFAEGAYGKVWLVRNAIGQWQALKAVYEAKFGDNLDPYEAEFEGIRRYKPISDKHPALLHVDFVSRRKMDGYYYYVMELGDSEVAGWEEKPELYRPCDLRTYRQAAPKGRLAVRDCVRIVIDLADALDFLHRQGLTHRDIKPSNIIFVKGRPKLADVGLVTELRLPADVKTFVGTPGYMPPAPEPPGTIQADIYGLGMVLYVSSTGQAPALFPELSSTLVNYDGSPEFMGLNAIIIKACQPDAAARYQSAAEMRDALIELQRSIVE